MRSSMVTTCAVSRPSDRHARRVVDARGLPGASTRPAQVVTAVVRLGERVGPEAGKGLGLDELGDGALVILGNVVDVVDGLAALVAQELVVLEPAQTLHCQERIRVGRRPTPPRGGGWGSGRN